MRYRPLAITIRGVHRCLRPVCAVLVCFAVTGAITGVAGADPSLHLQGAVNARDVGGYRTSDGRTVRTGMVFRSNTIARLTATDLAILEARDVRVIEDLRTASERVQAPDRVPVGAVDHWNDVLAPAPAAGSAFLTMPANRAFGNVLRDIAGADGAVLYHCSAGKDRTGWMTAVLLTVLGVDRTTVNRDFLLSNVYLRSPVGRPSVTINELDDLFAAVTRRYGSFDAYIHQGLGLSDVDVATVKLKLLT